ncbi:MAG TPA: RDD family protein [Actinophytocola sp.]|uniref:RDD family protein n=1 Tax=Actinophytocola sp. TaxID=1872138 RepID=UPI002DBCEC42|nr:RDD family protein [Actinophytocola sp.]HEU5472562.1 RDD family protein [Actinophytocola sp.]
MSKWIGSWLSGPRAALEPGTDTGTPAAQNWPGERLGLPERGPGSVAPLGARGLAFAVDAVLAALIAWGFTAPDPPLNWSLVPWFLITVVTVSFFGFTPGMGVLGIRVVRMDGSVMVGPLRAIPRTLLTFLIIPAALLDSDGRGLHDKVAATIVLRMR